MKKYTSQTSSVSPRPRSKRLLANGGTVQVTSVASSANTDFENFKHAFDKVFILDENNVAVRGGLSVLSENPEGSPATGGVNFDLLMSWTSDTTGKALSAELAKDFKLSTDAALTTLSEMLSDRYTKAEVDGKLLTKSSVSHKHDNLYSTLSHLHVIADVDRLQSVLDGKLAVGGKAVDSYLFEGLNKASFLPVSVFGYTLGHLVVLDVEVGTNAMLNVHITGHSYDTSNTHIPIDTRLQLYSYVSNNNNYLYSTTANNNGERFSDIKALHYNGKVAIWFKAPLDKAYQSISVYANTTVCNYAPEKTDGRNLVLSITNSDLPTEGVTLQKDFIIWSRWETFQNPAIDPNTFGDNNPYIGLHLIHSTAGAKWSTSEGDPFINGSVLAMGVNASSWQIGVPSTAGAHPMFRARWWSGRPGGNPWSNWEQLSFMSDVATKVDKATYEAHEKAFNDHEQAFKAHETTANNRFKAIEDYLTLLKGAFTINGVNVSVTGGLSANTYVSAGGVNTEGGGTGGNVNILQSWENYRSETENYATTAKLLYDVKSVSEAGIADLRAKKADKHDHPYAPTSHTHAWGQITGIPTEFIPKAHTHKIADVTGLQTALDGKAESSHVHTIANVTGLQGALDGKSNSNHNHDSAYLGKTAQAVDADKLDGKHASDFVDLTSSDQVISGSKYFGHAKLNVTDSVHTYMNVLISTNTAMEETEKGRVWRLLHTYKDNNETDNARGLNFYAYTNGSNGATHVARLTAHNDMPEFIVPYGRIKASRIEINGGKDSQILLGDGTTLSRTTLATVSGLNSGLALKLDKTDWDAFQTAFNKAFALNEDGSVTAKIGLSSEGYISAVGSNTTIGGTGGGNAYERLDSWTDYQEGQVLSAKLGKETHDQLQSLSDSVYTKTESDGKYVANEANKRLMTNAEGTKLAGLSNYTHPSSHSISEVSGLQDTINAINASLSNAVTTNTTQTISATKYFDSHMLNIRSTRSDYQQMIHSTLNVIPDDAKDKRWALHHMYYSEKSADRGLAVYSYDATGSADKVAQFKSHDGNSLYVYGFIQANQYKLPGGTDNQILLGSGAILDRTTLATTTDLALKLNKSEYDTHVADYDAHKNVWNAFQTSYSSHISDYTALKSAWSSFQTTYNSHISDYSSFKSNTNTRLTTLEGHNHDTTYSKLGHTHEGFSTLKIGEATISYDATNGMLKVDKGVYSEGAISSLGVDNTSVGGSGVINVLQNWVDDVDSVSGYALSAKLGYELRNKFVNYQLKENGKGLSTNDFTTALKSKLEGIANNANNYTHPSTHPFSIITSTPTTLSGYGITDAMLKDGSNSTSSSSSTILRALSGSSDTFTDNTLIVSSNASGESGNPAYYKRGANKLWEYIQGKTNALYPTKTELDAHKTEMNGKLTDGSVTKLGKATVGSSGQPIFLNNGVPTISQPSEAFFQWGGQHISNGFSPIDASMVSALGANRFAFWKQDGIKIEYSNDGGETWEDYGASAGVVQILSILESSGASLRAGKRDNGAMTDNLGQLRITIDFKNANIYTRLNKLVMYMSTNGCSAVNCLIETQKASVYNSNPSAFTYLTEARLTGWSGYNVVNIPDVFTYYNDLAQIRVMRLTFSTSANGTNNNPFLIHNIAGFGGVGWNTPSNMAKTGHLYAISWSQEATFPNRVKATGFYTDGTTNILTANGSSIDQSTFATSGHNHDSVYSKLSHTHDDRYYTETEIDTKLGTKADSVHKHQQSEIDGLSDILGEKSNVGHTHDDRYFTEEEVNAKLSDVNTQLTYKQDQIDSMELTIMEQQEQINALKAQLESVLSVLNISGNSIHIKGNITADGSIASSASVLSSPSTSGPTGTTTATPQPNV